MNFKFLYYKILRVLHLISEIEFKKKTAFYSAAYKIVSRSNLFDKAWYLSEYKEVQASGLSAIEHYLLEGFKTEMKPSKNFEAKKVFTYPYPTYYYGLHSAKAKKNAFVEHKKENRIENFIKKPRKVLFVTHELSLTGAPRALFNLAKIYKEQGYEPVVLSPLFGELEKELKHSAIEYYVEPLLLMKLLFKAEDCKNFFQFFDIIFFNTLPSLRFAPYIQSKNYKIAWIHEARLAFEREEASNDVKKLFESIDKVYSVGEYSKSFTDKYIAKEKSDILLYGIDEINDETLPEKQEQKLVFSIIGHCSERKGHDIFVNAVRALPEKIRDDCVFQIIGKIDKRKFSQKIKKIAKEEGIICMGQLAYKDTLEEMSKSDCIVCPSIDDPMPMVCSEAMMLKKVVLASKSTGTASFLTSEKNGFVFEANAKALQECIEKVYKEQEKLADIGKEGKKVYLENFTCDLFLKNAFSLMQVGR